MEKFRERLNIIDGQMLELFLARMRVAEEIGYYKKENGIPVEDKKREEQIIARMCQGADPEAAYYIRDFFEELIALSKDVQRAIEDGEKPAEF